MEQRVQRERIWREAVLAGDALAWQLGYEEAFAPLSGYVRWRVGGLPDLHEEIVQETWLTAVKSTSSRTVGMPVRRVPMSTE